MMEKYKALFYRSVCACMRVCVFAWGCVGVWVGGHVGVCFNLSKITKSTNIKLDT